VSAIPTEVEGYRLAPAGALKGTTRQKSVRNAVRTGPGLRIGNPLFGGD